MVKTLEDDFGIDVFDAKNQRKFLSPAAFKKMAKLMRDGQHSMIDVELANEVAAGLKKWATGRGATHWTHWFQPLTGLTAEKHDSFIGRTDADGHPILDLTGAELIRMEPDASSFPSGGLRNTAEARGYTIWDPVSPAFLMHFEYGAVLYIPCAFVSWTKEALDNKTPLLKSEEALSQQAVEMLNRLGDDSDRVFSTLGCEQDFFVLDRAKFLARPDLLQTGRTLQGAEPAKGQDLDDHYFNCIPRKVCALLQDIEMQLWRIGIPCTTRHNEVCPAQHEYAPVFETTSVAVDHQNIMMNVMKQKAQEHGFEITMHEKPFAGLNGSGKHNNWSVATAETNLLNPPSEPMDDPRKALVGLTNMRFTVFLAACIKAVDQHAGALRCAIANAGQDFRLGANEAPPAIISVYLGGSLQDMVDGVIEHGKEAWEDNSPSSPSAIKRRATLVWESSSRLPKYGRDRTDRNRTSPFAFTGNKWEFRAVGSSQNVAVPVAALNCALACALQDMNEEMEDKVNSGMNAEKAIRDVVVDTLTKHYRVIFNGDGYSPAWVEEAAKRGLPNFRSTPQALLGADMETIYRRTGVLSTPEVDARKNVLLENYIKARSIEARCLVQMTGKYFVPAGQLALARMGASQAVTSVPEVAATLKRVGGLLSAMLSGQAELKKQLKHTGELGEEATFIDETVSKTMDSVRAAADELEDLCTIAEWKLPTYHELLFIQCP